MESPEGYPGGSGLANAIADFGTPDEEPDYLNDMSFYNLDSSKKHRAIFATNIVDMVRLSLADQGKVMTIFRMLSDAARHDDVSMLIAHSLVDVVSLIEGDHAALKQLLGVFETLCLSSDAQVVTETCQTLADVISNNRNPTLFIDHFMPMVFRFATSGYSAPRSSGALLLHACYEFIADGEEQAMIRDLFQNLCEDSSVIVRRAAASTLSEWFSILGIDGPKFVLPLLHAFCRDQDHDTIRIAAVRAISSISLHVSSTAKGELTNATIALAQDESWRVRYVVGSEISTLASHLAANALTPSIVLLSQDEERQVRAITAAQLGVACEAASGDIVLADYLDVVTHLAHDEAADVRSSLARVMCSVAAHCPTRESADKLLPLVLRLLQETDAVKTELVPTLWKLGPKLLSEVGLAKELCEILSRIRSHKSWRLRDALAFLLRHFAPYLNIEPYANLLKDSMQFIFDPVAAVRHTMTSTLSTVSRQQGPKWTLRSLIDLAPHAHDVSYRSRQAFTSCFEVLLPALDDRATAEELSPVLDALSCLAKDPVDNVRLVLGRSLCTAVTPKVMQPVQADILKLLQRDRCADVAAAATPVMSKAPF